MIRPIEFNNDLFELTDIFVEKSAYINAARLKSIFQTHIKITYIYIYIHNNARISLLIYADAILARIIIIDLKL